MREKYLTCEGGGIWHMTIALQMQTWVLPHFLDKLPRPWVAFINFFVTTEHTTYGYSHVVRVDQYYIGCQIRTVCAPAHLPSWHVLRHVLGHGLALLGQIGFDFWSYILELHSGREVPYVLGGAAQAPRVAVSPGRQCLRRAAGWTQMSQPSWMLGCMPQCMPGSLQLLQQKSVIGRWYRPHLHESSW